MRALLIGLCMAVIGASASAEDYSAEARKIADEIIAVHPRGMEIEKDADFLAAREKLFETARDADLEHYALALGRLFHTVDDGHTAVLGFYDEDPPFAWRFPFRLKRFEDGVYVIAAKGEAAALLGGRLTKINGRPVNDVLRAYVPSGPAGNSAWPANWTPQVLSHPAWLLGLDVMQGGVAAPVKFTVAAANGRRISAKLVAQAAGGDGLVDMKREKAPLDGLGDGAENYVAEIDNKSALLLVIGGMEDVDAKSFEAFTNEAEAAMKATAAQRLIVDLRDNGGGDNILAEPLRRLIAKSRFNRPGGIYVLVSPQTFSAAMNFATRLERETDAFFVGEPTGGAPNQYGDPKIEKAPQSGMPYLISTLLWQDSTPYDMRRAILPDIPAPPAFADYVAGKDAALDAALTDKPAPLSDAAQRERIARPWERPSQAKSWRFFYEK